MDVRRTFLNWRWWVILPYGILFCIPVGLLINLGEYLQRHGDAFHKPLRWSIQPPNHRRK